MKMFAFAPEQYAEAYSSQGYVHISGGVSNGFLSELERQVDEFYSRSSLPDFAIGDKQQALYDFPRDDE